GRCNLRVGARPALLEQGGDLFEQAGIIACASINPDQQVLLVRQKALLPVFPLDPDGTHRAPIQSTDLQRLAHVTGGAGFRRDNQQDHLGITYRLTKCLARLLQSVIPRLWRTVLSWVTMVFSLSA